MQNSYDIIIIGGGHAGTEAAWAAANALSNGMAGGQNGRRAGVSGPDAPLGEDGGIRAKSKTNAKCQVPKAISVALITMDPSKIGAMSCNPAIGGLAKGQIVREIDALGGLMARATDATGIQFRVLNMSKGPAVRGPRAQCDKYAYAAEIQRLIATHPNIDVIAATVDNLIVEDGTIVGVEVPATAHVVQPDLTAIEWNQTSKGLARPVYQLLSPRGRGARGEGKEWSGESAQCKVQSLISEDSTRPTSTANAESQLPNASPPHIPNTTLCASAVVLTTGTFMRALMHTGETKTEGGRVDEGSAVGISGMLKSLGFELGRLKTGTPPRLVRASIDFSKTTPQWGDESPTPFSDWAHETRWHCHSANEQWHTRPAFENQEEFHFPKLRQIACYATQTSAEAHEIIRDNLHRAPMYSGDISAEMGPRYCPSIEDKVVRFPDRDSHHVFLEPESLHTDEIYCNGISTSLPRDVQEQVIRTMPGCEHAEILKLGYAVEYDMVWPYQIDATCMTKRVKGLFLAGQINGTSGYEEAGGQGLVAGLNAARLVMNREPVRLARDEAYIGVMMDDLVTKTPREPYRMFTSRAEHRLLLRPDNADLRLTPLARKWGLIGDQQWSAFEERKENMDAIRELFETVRIKIDGEGKLLKDIAKQPRASVDDMVAIIDAQLSSSNQSPNRQIIKSPNLIERLMTDYQYEGYIVRQQAEIKRQRKAENQRIPETFDYQAIPGLRNEAAEMLSKFQPQTMGQASRLAGVNPADLTLLAVALKRRSEATAG